MQDIIFLIGSQRSGTTIMQETLGKQNGISAWHEPYFIWEKWFSVKENDIYSENELTSEAIKQICNEYSIFGKKTKSKYILDKCPTHVFNIPVIHKIFPEARWIHMIRDGRDVALSIKKEWKIRYDIVHNKNLKEFFKIFKATLGFQHYMRYKYMVLWHEISSIRSLNPLRYLNKSRWEGKTGWGPRFKDWKREMAKLDEDEFYALQWVKCIEAVNQSWDLIPFQKKITVRYEDFIERPEDCIKSIVEKLELDIDTTDIKGKDLILRQNSKKWKTEFTNEEIIRISKILNPTLKKIGYLI